MQICSNHKNDTSRKNHGHSHAIDFHSIAPVAWMIICGDGLHNFIDGLGIGAAFTKSIYQGLNNPLYNASTRVVKIDVFLTVLIKIFRVIKENPNFKTNFNNPYLNLE